MTTGINKSYHRAIRYHVNGPRPHRELDESIRRITEIEERREKIKSKKIAFDDRAALGKQADRVTNGKELSDYCNNQLLNQYNQYGKYFVHRPSKTEFYVKRDYANHDTSPEDDLKLPIGMCEALLKKPMMP